MSITDELREYALGWDERNRVRRDLEHIADRIDAAYQKDEEELQAKDGQSWLHGYGECHAELMEGNEAIAADLERAGWIQLPKDADGVPIRVGDTLEGYSKTIKVVELRNAGTWHLVDEFGNEWHAHEAFGHAQPDSWERIIEDAAKNIYPNGAFNPCWDEVRDALVERCKRLAGEDK